MFLILKIFDHPHRGETAWYIILVAYVCMCVCQTITFESLDLGSSCFTLPVYLHGIRVKFVYEGHRVKVKVTGAKGSVTNAGSRNDQLRSAILIGTLQMAPHTTSRGWSGLMLEGKLV